ncbi:hypothetical protein [Sporolactobacillus nakayamae]|uniref:hypothetical protein n=1 Tax=Sporolactobacillus nakayamae TaxID=269670 RepID=UPI001160C7CB|nr:hypothetical protein [Sporolactobacillus nakayamae]
MVEAELCGTWMKEAVTGDDADLDVFLPYVFYIGGMVRKWWGRLKKFVEGFFACLVANLLIWDGWQVANQIPCTSVSRRHSTQVRTGRQNSQ